MILGQIKWGMSGAQNAETSNDGDGKMAVERNIKKIEEFLRYIPCAEAIMTSFS